MSFRPATTNDTAAINSAFLNAFRASQYTWGCPNEPFFTVARRAWEAMRGGPTPRYATTVAVPDDKPDLIVGYIVHRRESTPVAPAAWAQVAALPSVAWVYVAGDGWRKLGVARALLAQAGVTPGVRFTAIFGTPEMLGLARAHGYRPVFTPWATWQWV